MSNIIRVGVCQFLVGKNKADNLIKAVKYVADAKAKGAQLVVLPECFNSPYGTKFFGEYAEPIVGGASYKAMSAASKENKVWLVAGSIPEKDEQTGKMHNTSMTFSPQGELVAVHRKIHLFCINTPQLKVDEGETLSPGNAATVVDIGTCKMGIGICFDVRFAQLSIHYAELGTSLIVYPSAFNMVTGPKHWLLMAQARAIDAQQYVVMASPARDTAADYVAYGHSLVVDPMGDVLGILDENEGILMADIDINMVPKIRTSLPILNGTRHDLYDIVFKQ